MHHSTSFATSIRHSSSPTTLTAVWGSQRTRWCTTAKRAEAYIAFLRRTLPGSEYGMVLIGNPDTELTALPALEVDFSALPKGLAPILSFESKTEPESPYWTKIKFKKADVSDAERQEMEDHATSMFRHIDLKDYGRFDFRRSADGVIKLTEVNPNPVWVNDGKLAFMAGFAGHSYPQMLNMVLRRETRLAVA